MKCNYTKKLSSEIVLQDIAMESVDINIIAIQAIYEIAPVKLGNSYLYSLI